MDRQVCVIITVAYRARTDTQTPPARTDKKVKTEGPKILSNCIFYFKTMIISGLIQMDKQSFILLKRRGYKQQLPTMLPHPSLRLTMLPHPSLTLHTDRVSQRTAASMSLETFFAVTNPRFTEITDSTLEI